MGKVLIIDDKQKDLEVMNKYFYDIGFKEVFTASNSEEGIRKAEQEDPDLVIIDNINPEIDAFEICKKIKESKDTILPKIVVMTELIDAKTAEKAVKAGVDDLCIKTFDFSVLLQVVGKFVRNIINNYRKENKYYAVLKPGLSHRV